MTPYISYKVFKSGEIQIQFYIASQYDTDVQRMCGVCKKAEKQCVCKPGNDNSGVVIKTVRRGK